MGRNYSFSLLVSMGLSTFTSCFCCRVSNVGIVYNVGYYCSMYYIRLKMVIILHNYILLVY